MRAMKARGQKIYMLHMTNFEEAAAAGINMLSIEVRFMSPELREAAGDCFIQVGLPYGPFGDLVSAEDYMEKKHD